MLRIHAVPHRQNRCMPLSPLSSFSISVRFLLSPCLSSYLRLSISSSVASAYVSPVTIRHPPSLINGFWSTYNSVRAEAQRGPHSYATTMWWVVTRPPILHCKAWSTVSFPPHPSQVCISPCGCRPKWSRRLSLNSSVDIVFLFMRFSITVSHSLVTIALLSFCQPLLVSLSFSLSKCASSLSSLISRP